MPAGRLRLVLQRRLRIRRRNRWHDLHRNEARHDHERHAGRGSSLKAIGKPQYGRPSPSEPVLSGTAQVAYRNITVRPNTMRVKAGTTVRWTNYDEVKHNVTSQGGPQHFASKDFGPGGYFQIKLTRPGLVLYKCTIHPATMNGAIEVVAGGQRARESARPSSLVDARA